MHQQYPQVEEDRIKRGIEHVASLWQPQDGNEEDFKNYCLHSFVADDSERKMIFHKVSQYFESLIGHFNKISQKLQENLHLDKDPLHQIDKLFAGYDAGTHLLDDLYENKIAFYIALNFPYYPLEVKEKNGVNWSRMEWAYARLGDEFTFRIPAHLKQVASEAAANADIYLSEYNIMMGQLLTENGKKVVS